MSPSISRGVRLHSAIRHCSLLARSSDKLYIGDEGLGHGGQFSCCPRAVRRGVFDSIDPISGGVGEGRFQPSSRGPIHGDGDLVRHIVVHMPTPLPFSKDIDFDAEHVRFQGKADIPSSLANVR